MGDAKRRREAIARGEPWPEDINACPACRSRRTTVEKAPPMGLSHVSTGYGVCLDCETIWEAYPPGWQHEVVGADPCDNCAFRQGSPETLDRDGWKALLAALKAGNVFQCHKGAPILIDKEAGTITFDPDWIARHGRTCAGFHQAIMTRPGWLAARFGITEAELHAAVEEGIDVEAEG